MKPAIIIPAISVYAEEAREHVRQVHEAEATESAFGIKLNESKEEAAARRIQAGRYLISIRGKFPRRGTAENGWGAFLEAIECNPSTAQRWMDEADPSRLSTRARNSNDGADQPDSGAPTDADVPPTAEASGVCSECGRPLSGDGGEP